MDKSYAYVALLDVLGYRKFLEADRQAGTLEFKDRLQAAIAVLADLNEGEYPYQAISDTIIISSTDRSGFIGFCGVVKKVYIAFLGQGLLVRGGITFSQHFKSGPITYSHAVASSYALESGSAIVPRVMISSDVLDLQENQGTHLAGSGLVCQQNGSAFLDVVDEGNVAKLYSLAKSLYVREMDNIKTVESAFMKHLWLEYYLTTHRWAKGALKRKYIDGILPS
jgi:hypothetical protein